MQHSDIENAKTLSGWALNRGGVAVWQNQSLSDPGAGDIWMDAEGLK